MGNSLYEVNLGCATTEELFMELMARFPSFKYLDSEIYSLNTRRCHELQAVLDTLTEAEKKYRTVDS